MTLEEKKAEEWLQSIEGDDCVIITDREERKQAYITGFKDGLKMKVNTTTISDAPLMEREKLEQAKEIIREFMQMECCVLRTHYGAVYNELLHKAEQFLEVSEE